MAAEQWKTLPCVAQPVAPVCPIAYTEEYIQVFDRVRGVLASGDRDQRVLDLTAIAVELSPAHYTAWQLRRECLAANKIDPVKELEFCSLIGRDNPKNYQVWHHRLQVLFMHPSPKSLVVEELRFIELMLSDDAKNYHAWTYRQWLLTHFPDVLWDDELERMNTMLDLDVWNNSAWNQRYFILFNRPDKVLADLPAIIGELTWTLERIKMAPTNEAPYNYILGLSRRYPKDLVPLIGKYCLDAIGTAFERRISHPKDLPNPASIMLLRTIVELMEEHGVIISLWNNSWPEITSWALQLLKSMDSVRENYWIWVEERLSLSPI